MEMKYIYIFSPIVFFRNVKSSTGPWHLPEFFLSQHLLEALILALLLLKAMEGCHVLQWEQSWLPYQN